MESNKEVKGVYLYITFYKQETKKIEAFIAVTKAVLFNEVASEIECLGNNAILFSSALEISEIKEKLKKNNAHYLLLDLSISHDLESVYGFFPESKIEIINKITKNIFSKEKPYLKRKLDNSVKSEQFELAAPLRDFNKL